MASAVKNAAEAVQAQASEPKKLSGVALYSRFVRASIQTYPVLSLTLLRPLLVLSAVPSPTVASPPLTCKPLIPNCIAIKI